MPSNHLQWILNHGKIRLTAAPILYHCPATWNWHVDSLPEHALLLVFDGRGKLTLDGQAAELRKGICYFLKPGIEVQAQQTPSYPLFIFLVRFDILDTEENCPQTSEGDAPYQSVFIRNVRNLEALAELVATRKSDDPLLADAITMIIRLLVESATRHSGAFDSQAYEALHAIENDLARKWTVQDLAAEAGMPTKRFAQSFRQMMNEAPIHYVIRRRMEEAKRQIQQSSLPIEEIAINLGYSDLKRFHQLFQRRLGYSPASLRENRDF
ncbi:AraC family transcriptional regulator [Pelagicoccus sp. SDUM812005]|uniref:AraC family transcriptional regulator n=1 Tax=Pelagicoccus sp. SDUM812005 TaxID=3041257 RepID=UPI00280C7395|nr:AraC family transcriptional regulator [Pelagicoccus sp. SDUM812005]MDQ8180116.1 AraC family transcriptional regulator [Pelagicoccus sp. SDUM812005]